MNNSCSRVHAAIVYHKHLKRSFLIDLESTKKVDIVNPEETDPSMGLIWNMMRSTIEPTAIVLTKQRRQSTGNTRHYERLLDTSTSTGLFSGMPDPITPQWDYIGATYIICFLLT
ncbi:uncharacterized protein LOC126978275 [Leptidea sinapis]|uniref:uncharacterized protein LOC126978275 n=1 Tax=Leptidea sinapis TaxID=189913 RepID=UPI0021432489|nr:uncharacterized protein LOC126978275 [Leptidea sinapis]